MAKSTDKLVFREALRVERLLAALKALPGALLTGKLIRAVALLTAIAELLSAMVFDYPLTPRGEAINMSEWELVWSDEFSGSSLDTSVWNSSGDGIRRGGYWDFSQAFVDNGNLIIRTQYRDDIEGKEGWYTAGIETKDFRSFKYGYFECRCICSPGAGVWSAFWTFSHGVGNVDGSGRDGAEIDIFESPNFAHPKQKVRSSVNHSVHFDGYGPAHNCTYMGNYYVNNPYTEYNTYGVEWTADELIFYINGVECDRISGNCVPQAAEWLMLSSEVNGSNGVPGMTNDGTIDAGSNGIITDNPEDILPLDFVVDYVRVYQRTGA